MFPVPLGSSSNNDSVKSSKSIKERENLVNKNGYFSRNVRGLLLLLLLLLSLAHDKNIIAAEEHTAQKMKFSIKDFFSKCYQIRSFPRIWSHLLKKSLMENSIFFTVILSTKWFKYQYIFHIGSMILLN